MTPQQIKIRLKAKKLTQTALAKRFGVSQTSIQYLIHRKIKSRRLERSMARALGLTLEEFNRKGNGKKLEAVNE